VYRYLFKLQVLCVTNLLYCALLRLPIETFSQLNNIVTKFPRYNFRVVEYPCLDCDLATKFPSPAQLADHLNRSHRKVDESLRVMMIKRKKPRNPEFRESGEDAHRTSDESLLPPLARVCGVKNETGLDCFSIAGLHLLAQTDISNRLTVKDHHSNCPSPSCLLGNFLSAYHSSKRRVISDKPLVDHYDKVSSTLSLV